MNTEIIVAIISFIGMLCGSAGGILVANKLVNYRIEQLEKKVEKHNNVVDRVYALETHRAVVDKEIKVTNNRIKDLEEYHK